MELVVPEAAADNLQFPFWGIVDCDLNELPSWVEDCHQLVLPYVKTFLCAKHPHRKGKICPFVPSAINNNMIFFSYIEKMIDIKIQITSVKKCADQLLQEKEKNNFPGAVIILFPKTFDINLLLNIHQESKAYCVERSLMVGALFSQSNAESLHSKNYFPLRTPVPTLVIRDMVPSDLIFLYQEHYNLKERLIFLKSYIITFRRNNNRISKDQVVRSKKLYWYYFARRNLFYLLIVILVVYLTIT